MPNDFFKHNDKVYAENLNDGILVGNSFNFSIEISLPTDTGGAFPSATTTVKARVADVTPSANSNLSIGETISNNSGSSQDYRLTVYPNFNRFGGFSHINLTGSGCSVKVCEKGESTEIVSGLDYDDLSNVAQLKHLKEYDIVVTIPNGKTLTGLGFGFQSRAASVNSSISQANVSGLVDDLSSLESGKADAVHSHTTSTVVERNALSHIGTSVNDSQSVVNEAVDEKVGSLSTSITNINTYTTYIDNENYTVKYNEYRVIIDVHLSSTTFPATLSNFGADVIPSDCLPSQPVTVPLQNVNAIVSIRDNSQGIWRKSNTGSLIQGVSCYCHIEYSRV